MKKKWLGFGVLFLAAIAAMAQPDKKSVAQAEEARRFEQPYEIQPNDTFSATARRWSLNEGVELFWDYPLDVNVKTTEQQDRINQAVKESVAKNGEIGKGVAAAVNALIQLLNQNLLLRYPTPLQRGDMPLAKVCVFGRSPEQPTAIRVTWGGENCAAPFR